MTALRNGCHTIGASALSSKRTPVCTMPSTGDTGARKGTSLRILIVTNSICLDALQEVHAFFEKHPEVEVVLAGTIVVDGNGKYVCHRHSLVPKASHIWFRFPVLTSSLFIRRRVIEERGIFFDTSWRDLGDLHWVLALLRAQCADGSLRIALLQSFPTPEKT